MKILRDYYFGDVHQENLVFISKVKHRENWSDNITQLNIIFEKRV